MYKVFLGFMFAWACCGVSRSFAAEEATHLTYLIGPGDELYVLEGSGPHAPMFCFGSADMSTAVCFIDNGDGTFSTGEVQLPPIQPDEANARANGDVIL